MKLYRIWWRIHTWCIVWCRSDDGQTVPPSNRESRSLKLWPDRIGHNNTPLPALALSCCRSCCCLLRSLEFQPLFFLFHRPVDFFLAANLALVNWYFLSAWWACAFVLKGNNLRAASTAIPLWWARRQMPAVLVINLVDLRLTKESPKQSILIFISLWSSLSSLSLRWMVVFVK